MLNLINIPDPKFSLRPPWSARPRYAREKNEHTSQSSGLEIK